MRLNNIVEIEIKTEEKDKDGFTTGYTTIDKGFMITCENPLYNTYIPYNGE